MSWIVTEAPDRQLGAEDASRWERVVKGSSRFKVEKQGGKSESRLVREQMKVTNGENELVCSCRGSANGQVVPGKEVWRIRPGPIYRRVGSSLELSSYAGLFIRGT